MATQHWAAIRTWETTERGNLSWTRPKVEEFRRENLLGASERDGGREEDMGPNQTRSTVSNSLILLEVDLAYSQDTLREMMTDRDK